MHTDLIPSSIKHLKPYITALTPLSLQILSYSSDLDTSQVMLTAIILKAVLLPRGYSCLHPRIWQFCLRECLRVHRRMYWNSMEGCPQEDLSNERETTPYLSSSFVQSIRINVITITWEGLANPFLLIIHLNETAAFDVPKLYVTLHIHRGKGGNGQNVNKN